MSKSVDIDNLPYRPCVGIMVINKNGKVFVGERLDTPDAWQMPQGGIDKGEDAETAALRELEEEIGVRPDQVTVISKTDDWLYYDLPRDLVAEGKIWRGKYRGQKQLWYLLQLNADDSAINIDVDHAEFGRWQWVDVSKLTDLIVPFKRDIYAQLTELFCPIINDYKDA